MTKMTRAYNRVTAFIPVTVRTEKGTIFKGEIEDISLGGASIRCAPTLTPGDKVSIELHFAGLKSVFGSIVEVDEIDDNGLVRANEMAEVRWQKGGTQMGIKFVNLSADTKRFLSRLVKFFDRLKGEDIAS